MPIGGDTGGSGNLSTSLSNVARLAAHTKFVWVFNAYCDGTIIYNNPVYCKQGQKSIARNNACSIEKFIKLAFIFVAIFV
jgi:hypothetical protein